MAVLLICGVGTAVIGLLGERPPKDAPIARSHRPSTRRVVPTVDEHADRDDPAGAVRSIHERQRHRGGRDPFGVTTVKDCRCRKRTTKVRTRGVPGLKRITYEVTYADGVETGRTKLARSWCEKPVTKVVAVGTKQPRCDPNYAGACVPIASDVDCAGGSGRRSGLCRGSGTGGRPGHLRPRPRQRRHRLRVGHHRRRRSIRAMDLQFVNRRLIEPAGSLPAWTAYEAAARATMGLAPGRRPPGAGAGRRAGRSVRVGPPATRGGGVGRVRRGRCSPSRRSSPARRTRRPTRSGRCPSSGGTWSTVPARPVYQLWLCHMDCGTLFGAGTTDESGYVAQFHLHDFAGDGAALGAARAAAVARHPDSMLASLTSSPRPRRLDARISHAASSSALPSCVATEAADLDRDVGQDPPDAVELEHRRQRRVSRRLGIGGQDRPVAPVRSTTGRVPAVRTWPSPSR